MKEITFKTKSGFENKISHHLLLITFYKLLVTSATGSKRKYIIGPKGLTSYVLIAVDSSERRKRRFFSSNI